MIKHWKVGVALAALLAGGGVVYAQGAGNIIGTVTSGMLVPIDSGTLASDTTVDALASYVFSTAASPVLTGNLKVTGTLEVDGASSLGGAAGAASVTVPVVSSAVNEISLSGAITTAAPLITVGGSGADTNIGIVVAGKGTGAFHAGGTTTANASLRVPTVASAVNQVEIGGAVATTGIPYITVGGSGADTNAAISLAGKGTGNVLIGGATTSLAGLQVAQTASAVNDLLVTNGATGTPAKISSSTVGADTNAGIDITPKGSSNVRIGGTIATCSGTTTATCQGQHFVASVTGLSTAAGGASSAAMTVTDANVLSSASIVMCQVNGYGGTGVPIASTVTPGTGSVSFTITNVAASGSLNATVPVACFVFGT